MNKRGDVAVVLFVVLVLVSCSSILYTFFGNSNKIEAEITNISLMENFYLKENQAEFYLKEMGEISVFNSYEEIVSKDNYIGDSSLVYNQDDVEFGLLKDVDMVLHFNFWFFKEVEKKNFDLELIDFDKLDEKGKLDIYFKEDNFNFTLKGIEMGGAFGKLNIIYRPEIYLEFNLTKLGLHDFKTIYEVKEGCVLIETQKEMQDCFNKGLFNFDVKVEERSVPGIGESDYLYVDIFTKKSFFDGNSFKKIRFGFIPVRSSE